MKQFAFKDIKNENYHEHAQTPNKKKNNSQCLCLPETQSIIVEVLIKVKRMKYFAETIDMFC
jgi:phage-related protein